MIGSSIFVFIFAMWILIIIGGGIAVLILGPISVTDFGELNFTISSVIKAVISIALVVTWIFILTKVKNWIFRKNLEI